MVDEKWSWNLTFKELSGVPERDISGTFPNKIFTEKKCTRALKRCLRVRTKCEGIRHETVKIERSHGPGYLNFSAILQPYV